MWPIACSAFAVAASSAPGSAEITSGIHWWWKRGSAATCLRVQAGVIAEDRQQHHGDDAAAAGRAEHRDACSSDSMKVGVIELSMRLPGFGALASKPITPNAFGVPGLSAKSSISLLSSTPVPGGTRPEPYGRFTVWVHGDAVAFARR